jgi:hypothetical protein
MAKFSEDGLFEREQCLEFLHSHLPRIRKDLLFRIKKYLLPALVGMAKHLEYPTIISSMYSSFVQFTKDEVWGVRKTCIESLPKIVPLLKISETEKFSECVNFF